MTSRTTGFFDTSGERIYYESFGEGDPVVLCHGLGGNHASWWQVVPTLSGLHRVVTWDQRGFGNSTRRTGRYGPEPAVEDLLGLLDHLEIDSVQLLGQSMGGWVAMGFALAHGERVSSLVLTDTLAGIFTAEIDAVVRRAGAALRERPRTDTVGEHRALGESFCRRQPHLALLYQEISNMGDKPDDSEIFAMLGAMRVPLEQVAGLDLPALLVVGDCDTLCPPEAMRLVADEIPGALLEVIEDAGHSPYFERPEEWAAVVGSFLGRHVPHPTP